MLGLGLVRQPNPNPKTAFNILIVVWFTLSFRLTKEGVGGDGNGCY